MSRLFVPLSFALALCILAGCKGGEQPTKQATTTPAKQSSELVLKMDGPGGTVGIGDDVAIAKKAFPAPKGAQVYDNSMSYTIITPSGWCWSSDNDSFEVATKDGKIIAIGLIHNAPQAGEPAKTITKLGEPTRKAEGNRAKVYVWENGENARFWITVSGGGMDVGSIELIGNKEDLKLLNYHAEDPQLFVRQLDGIAETLKPAFEEAKRKAKEKAKQRAEEEHSGERTLN